MNKEYEDLLNYIASFERSQQQDEVKLAEEIARHKHTKNSIQTGTAPTQALTRAQSTTYRWHAPSTGEYREAQAVPGGYAE